MITGQTLVNYQYMQLHATWKTNMHLSVTKGSKLLRSETSSIPLRKAYRSNHRASYSERHVTRTPAIATTNIASIHQLQALGSCHLDLIIPIRLWRVLDIYAAWHIASTWIYRRTNLWCIHIAVFNGDTVCWIISYHTNFKRILLTSVLILALKTRGQREYLHLLSDCTATYLLVATSDPLHVHQWIPKSKISNTLITANRRTHS